MTGAEKIRVINAADLLSIPETIADIILILDRETTLANGTLPFPDNPINGQLYTLITKSQITNFGVDTGTKLISGFPTTLLATEMVSWIFDTAANTWFCSTNYARWGTVAGTLSEQTDLQTALNGKQAAGSYLAPDGNGGSLTGLTKTQVGLSNVDNTTDAGKPVSTAQQTALNLKANLSSLPVYARVTGSNATTTGQVLVDIAGLSVALTTTAVYEFEAIMSCSTSAVTTGIQYGVQFSAAGATIESHITGASSTTAAKAERILALNTATTAFLATSNQHGGIRIRGIITTGANAGNLTIRHLKVTSGTSTVFINSFLKVTRIS